MKIHKQNISNYHDQNKAFHEAVDGAVQNILQHQSVGTIGYISARVTGAFTATSDDRNQPIELLDRFDVSGLGNYEKHIISRLILGRYRTNVLRGEMGSGKSSTIDHIIDALKRPRQRTCGVCEQCNPIIIKLNFNAGFRDDNSKVLVKEFRQQLYDQLRQELRQLFKITNLTDTLRNEVVIHQGHNRVYAAFDRFVQTHENSITWRTHSKAEKANLLFNYIDECTKNGTENLTVIMILVNFVKIRLRSDPACLILIFDNIDSVLPEAQFTILAEILAYQETAQVQSLVALRRATFKKFEQNRAALSFGTIDHSGPDIKEIILRRLNNYKNNWSECKDINEITNPSYRQALKDRLDYLISTKDDVRGGIQRVAALCGASIRQGLFTSERFFMNSVTPWDSPPHNKDEMFRAILIGNREHNEIDSEDSSVTNLLANIDNGDASLLNIRILQLIAEFDKDEPNRTVSKLIEMLNNLGGWSREEIRLAFNYLLYMRKPLLWVDGRTKYDKLQIGKHSDDVLYLTEAGRFYLHDLLFDLVYIQEAALSVKWSARYIPETVDYSHIMERFKVLRYILDELASMDCKEIQNFKKWLSGRKSLAVRPVFITSRIIASLGRSTLHILLQRIADAEKLGINTQTKLTIIEEIKDWQSLIIKWLNKETQVLGYTSRKLEKLSGEYRLRLMLR